MTLEAASGLNEIAYHYVRLALALGQHEPGYIDAYYGDKGLQQQAEQACLSLDSIVTQAEDLQASIYQSSTNADNVLIFMRRAFLEKQIISLAARARMCMGECWNFDAESQLLYDSVAPCYDEAHFERLLTDLDRLLPGKGDFADRYSAYRCQFVIPREKLDLVFQAAIKEARQRTLQHACLPVQEAFQLEYVTNKVWSGYNWYRGGAQSLIQINTDLPIYIDRAIDLAAHEGYPGHHVYNSLLEKKLYQERGWIEFCVYPLYSPQSLIAEGTANYGIEMTFPSNERINFECEVLFPLAGLDAKECERYYRLHALMQALNYANNEVGRLYLSRKMSREAAIEYLERYMLYEPERAEQRLKFIEINRSYVINYNWGQELVRRYVEYQADNDCHTTRWQKFLALLSTPRTPSGLENKKIQIC